jgi:hypothetical protein
MTSTLNIAIAISAFAVVAAVVYLMLSAYLKRMNEQFDRQSRDSRRQHLQQSADTRRQNFG